MSRARFAIALVALLAGCERKATQVPTIATESTADVFGPGASKLRETSSDDDHPFELALRRRLLERTMAGPKLQNRDLAVAGTLLSEVVTRILRQQLARMGKCYEAGLKRDPDLEGAAAFRFVIESDGAVSSATATTPTLPDAAMMTCVTNALREQAFPSPEAGKVTVSFVTTFESDG